MTSITNSSERNHTSQYGGCEASPLAYSSQEAEYGSEIKAAEKRLKYGFEKESMAAEKRLNQNEKLSGNLSIPLAHFEMRLTTNPIWETGSEVLENTNPTHSVAAPLPPGIARQPLCLRALRGSPFAGKGYLGLSVRPLARGTSLSALWLAWPHLGDAASARVTASEP